MTYDQDKATDRAGDDADVRLDVSEQCQAGGHAECTGMVGLRCADCACDCHYLVDCKCHVCGAEFKEPYESYLCDACLDKPWPRPVGVFEP
jgi:hypothetical protein